MTSWAPRSPMPSLRRGPNVEEQYDIKIASAKLA
jgi:hypothetical protein